ncbi:KAP family P-loop NTPase fold protein [Streptomyces xiamenensis]
MDQRFFNDDPVDGSQEAPDLLGRQHYAHRAVQLLQQVRQQTESGVLALIGPWGAGKSSVLGMVKKELKSGAMGGTLWSVAEVNPWMYSDLDSIALSLFGEIRASLPKEDRWSEARKNIGQFTKVISPLGRLTSVLGLDSESYLHALGTGIEGDTSVSAVQRTVEDALRENGRPLLVIMDDLDRLTPDELLLVFKLVRLVGRLPNIYYLLSFDEQTLRDVLRRTDLVGGSETRAQEFLEKIFQVRLDLPPLTEREAARLVDQSLAVILEQHDLVLSDEDIRRFNHAHLVHLGDRLRTPRTVKRYFGQVNIGLTQNAVEVDLTDFLVITFLRTSEPGVYRMLQRHRAELTGTGRGISADRSREEQMATWRERLADAGVASEHLEGVRQLLALMFSAVQSNIGEGWGLEPVNRRGIGHGDYFDRYFTVGVPHGDFPDAEFSQGLIELGSDPTGDAATSLINWMRSETHRFARRVTTHIAHGSDLPARALLVTLASNYNQLTQERDAPVQFLTAESSVVNLTGNLIGRVAPNERLRALDEMTTTLQGVLLAGEVMAIFAGADEITESAWYRDGKLLLTSRVRQRMASAAAKQARELTEDELRLLWAWRHLDAEGVRAWVKGRLDSTWQLMELLERLIPSRHRTFSISTDGTLQDLDGLIELPELYERLAGINPATDIATPRQQELLTELLQSRTRHP